MYRNDLPMKVIRIINYLPSLECKVALFVSLVFVLGWMVDSTSISKALLIYLFIFGFGEEGGGWCLWQIGGESEFNIFHTATSSSVRMLENY